MQARCGAPAFQLMARVCGLLPVTQPRNGGARTRRPYVAGTYATRVVPLPRCPRPRQRQRRRAGGGSSAELNMQQISSHSDWSKDGFR